MNKIVVATVFFSAVIAGPVLADDIPAKSSMSKTAMEKSSMHRHHHKLAEMKDGCETQHEMGASRGHGMMGGAGMGMMDGGMGGAGMMMEPDRRMLGMLDISDEQRSKIKLLADELRHTNWSKQGLINDESAKLSELYQADKRDPAAIGGEYQKIFDLKRQMIETYLDTQNRIEAILTDEQRAKMKEARCGMHPEREQWMHR